MSKVSKREEIWTRVLKMRRRTRPRMLESKPTRIAATKMMMMKMKVMKTNQNQIPKIKRRLLQKQLWLSKERKT
jgi:hypothetical protein